MTLRGRPPKPTPLKILDGTRKDRINYAEPQPAVIARKPPLKMGKLARAKWKEIVSQLVPTRVLTETDYGALKLLCDAHELYELSHAVIQKHGATYEQEIFHRGEVVGTKTLERLEYQHRKDASEALLKYYAYFGMTPVSRSKVSVTAPKTAESQTVGARKREGA